MTLAELEAELKQVEDERNRQYWAFTRTARGKPVEARITRRSYELQEQIRVLRRATKEAAMKRWTKVDIKTMQSAIDTFHLHNRPPSGPTPGELKEKIRAYLDEHRKEIIEAGIRELREIVAERAKQNAETAAHFSSNPSIYGTSTPDMVHRFRKEAVGCERSVVKADKLIARVKAETLPPEVESYYPC